MEAWLTLHCLSPVVLLRKTNIQPREMNSVSVFKIVIERVRFYFINNLCQIMNHWDPSRNHRMKISIKS